MQQNDFKKPDKVVYTQGQPLCLDTPDYEFDFTVLQGDGQFFPTVTFSDQVKMGEVSISPQTPDIICEPAESVIKEVTNQANFDQVKGMTYIASAVQAISSRKFLLDDWAPKVLKLKPFVPVSFVQPLQIIGDTPVVGGRLYLDRYLPMHWLLKATIIFGGQLGLTFQSAVANPMNFMWNQETDAHFRALLIDRASTELKGLRFGDPAQTRVCINWQNYIVNRGVIDPYIAANQLHVSNVNMFNVVRACADLTQRQNANIGVWNQNMANLLNINVFQGHSMNQVISYLKQQISIYAESQLKQFPEYRLEAFQPSSSGQLAQITKSVGSVTNAPIPVTNNDMILAHCYDVYRDHYIDKILGKMKVPTNINPFYVNVR